MVIDNVGKELVARHQGGIDNEATKTKGSPRHVHVWTMIYALQHRINGGDYGTEDFDINQFTTHVDSSATNHFVCDYLPTPLDYKNRRKRFSVLIQRILKQNFHCFKMSNVVQHIEHQYSKEINQKSNVAMVGVQLENPGTLEGMSAVTTHLQQFVPRPNGVEAAPVPIQIHGDAATVLMMMTSMRSRRFALQRSDRLDGLWPVPGEFHRRMLHLQDSYTELYNTESSKQRGTLGNIRTKMNFQGVHPKVSDSFAHNEDLLHLTTRGLVCLVALELLQCDSMDEARTNQSLENTAEKICTYFWHQPSVTEIQEVIDHRVDGWHEQYGCLCGVVDGKCKFVTQYFTALKCLLFSYFDFLNFKVMFSFVKLSFKNDIDSLYQHTKLF